MTNSLRQRGLADDAAAITPRPLGTCVPTPPIDNARILSEITVRAVSVNQTLDKVGRELDDLAKRIP